MPYYTPTSQENKLSTQNSLGVAPLMETPFSSNTNENEKDNLPDQDIKIDRTPPVNDIMANIDENSIYSRLQHSLDFVVAQAERLYYNCDYQKCNNLTESILKQDPYHSACLPIHISCQVELKQSNSKCDLCSEHQYLY